MSDEQKVREEEVFAQDLSLDDLDAAAGGRKKATTGTIKAIFVLHRPAWIPTQTTAA